MTEGRRGAHTTVADPREATDAWPSARPNRAPRSTLGSIEARRHLNKFQEQRAPVMAASGLVSRSSSPTVMQLRVGESGCLLCGLQSDLLHSVGCLRGSKTFVLELLDKPGTGERAVVQVFLGLL